jgi:hypothetical protein
MTCRPVIIATLLWVAPTVVIAQDRTAAGAIESILEQSLPLPHRTKARLKPIPAGAAISNIGLALVKASGVPIVFEVDVQHSLTAQDVDLTGRTVRQTLDLLTELNPSYLWREEDGVVVIRPRTAWSDPSHPFNRSAHSRTGLSWTDLTAKGILNNVAALLWGMPVEPWRTSSRDAHRFSIDMPTGSILDVLIASARARGDMVWFIGTIGPRLRVSGPDDALGFSSFKEDGDYSGDFSAGISGAQNFVKQRKGPPDPG